MSLRIWWKAWRELVRKLFALAGSLASLVGLLVFFLPSPVNLPWWAVALLVFTAVSAVVRIVFEFKDHQSRRVFAKRDTEGIKKYMHDWIEHGGRVATGYELGAKSETRSLLSEKARRGELILCLPEPNAFATDLSRAGAEVCAYGARRLESPASRFTIAFFGRDGSAVSVGRAEGDSHVIEEFSAGSHPVFHVAENLIALVRSLQGQPD